MVAIAYGTVVNLVVVPGLMVEVTNTVVTVPAVTWVVGASTTVVETVEVTVTEVVVLVVVEKQ